MIELKDLKGPLSCHLINEKTKQDVKVFKNTYNQACQSHQ